MMTTKCRSGTGCRESSDLDRELSDVLIAISVVSKRIADRITAVSGKQWKDWKIVEGRSNRKYVNETAVADTVKNSGYDPFEHKVLGITAMTKLLFVTEIWKDPTM